MPKVADEYRHLDVWDGGVFGRGCGGGGVVHRMNDTEADLTVQVGRSLIYWGCKPCGPQYPVLFYFTVLSKNNGCVLKCTHLK